MVWDCVMLVKGSMGVGCWVFVDWREEILGLGIKLNVGEFSGMMSWEGARGGLGVWD